MFVLYMITVIFMIPFLFALVLLAFVVVIDKLDWRGGVLVVHDFECCVEYFEHLRNWLKLIEPQRVQCRAFSCFFDCFFAELFKRAVTKLWVFVQPPGGRGLGLFVGIFFFIFVGWWPWLFDFKLGFFAVRISSAATAGGMV